LSPGAGCTTAGAAAEAGCESLLAAPATGADFVGAPTLGTAAVVMTADVEEFETGTAVSVDESTVAVGMTAITPSSDPGSEAVGACDAVEAAASFPSDAALLSTTEADATVVFAAATAGSAAGTAAASSAMVALTTGTASAFVSVVDAAVVTVAEAPGSVPTVAAGDTDDVTGEIVDATADAALSIVVEAVVDDLFSAGAVCMRQRQHEE